MTVFISRKKNQSADLILALEKEGYSVIANSMIQTETVHFHQPLPQSDWIFFSSAEGVNHFFKQLDEIPKTKFGAVGTATAETLNGFVHTDFIGDSSDIPSTAKKFASLTENESVLFPISEQSLKNIQAAKDPSLVFNITCYRTLSQPANVGSPDVLVFSSPSNVDAFFLLNTLNSSQKCIAFGISTADALRKYGVENPIIPQSLTTSDLFKTIKSAS